MVSQGGFCAKVDQFTATARHREVISCEFTGDSTYFSVDLTATGPEQEGRILLGRLLFFPLFNIPVFLFFSQNVEDMKAATLRADHGDLTVLAALLNLQGLSLLDEVCIVIQAQTRGIGIVLFELVVLTAGHQL